MRKKYPSKTFYKGDSVESFQKWFSTHKEEQYSCGLFYSSRGCLDFLKIIYEDPESTIPEKMLYSKPILSYAAKHGHLDIVRYLHLTHKHTLCDTSFGYALRHNQMEIMRYFMDNGYLIKISTFYIPNQGTRFNRKISKSQMNFENFVFCMDNISHKDRTQRWKIIEDYSTRFITRIYRKFSPQDLSLIYKHDRFELDSDKIFLMSKIEIPEQVLLDTIKDSSSIELWKCVLSKTNKVDLQELLLLSCQQVFVEGVRFLVNEKKVRITDENLIKFVEFIDYTRRCNYDIKMGRECGYDSSEDS